MSSVQKHGYNQKMKADTEIDAFQFDSSSCDNTTSKRRETPLPLLGNFAHSSAICSLGALLTILFWFGE